MADNWFHWKDFRSFVAYFLFALNACFVVALDNGVALTPPMGWMSWLRFECNLRCDIDLDNCISERLYKRIADSMIKDGYLAAGYQYVAIDDCWMSRTRLPNGSLQADPQRFPSGIKALADYMHARGLMLGIYLDIGDLTCAGYPGSKNYFNVDARTMAEWGVDFVKMDGCNANPGDYEADFIAFGQALNRTGRRIVYYCEWPMYARYYGQKVNYALIAQHCNMFRALTDIYYIYHSIEAMVDYISRNPYNLSRYAGPGAFNDADSLAIGNFGLSESQERMQMGMWAIMTMPLIMSNDLRDIRRSSKKLLQNRHVIAINQDPLGIQGTQVAQYVSTSIWVKPILPKGSCAVAILNQERSGGRRVVVFSLSNLIPGIIDPSSSSSSSSSASSSSSSSFSPYYNVIEVFDDRLIGRFKATDSIRVSVDPMGVYLIKVIPTSST